MQEAPEPVAPPEPPQIKQHSPWPNAVMWMVIVLILVAGGLFIFKSCRDLPGEMLDRTGKTVEKAGQALADIASAFKRGTVTTSFISYATTISNYQYLQFATLKQMEIFTHMEEPSIAFGYIPLPDIIVEARARVEYTYYLDLNGKWDFVLKDNTIYVFAPPIRFNKPAVDASAITYEVKKGYIKSAEAQENLKRSISSLVVLRARENIPLVRENGRKQTAQFVENWLAKSFTDGKQYPVKVYFPDESQKLNITPSPSQ